MGEWVGVVIKKAQKIIITCFDHLEVISNSRGRFRHDTKKGGGGGGGGGGNASPRGGVHQAR